MNVEKARKPAVESFSELSKMNGQFVEADLKDRKGPHFYRVIVPSFLKVGNSNGVILQGGVLPGNEKSFGRVQMIVTEDDFTNPRNSMRKAISAEVTDLVFCDHIII